MRNTFSTKFPCKNCLHRNIFPVHYIGKHLKKEIKKKLLPPHVTKKIIARQNKS